MVSRRNVLRAGNAALLAAIAGCTSAGGSSNDTTTETEEPTTKRTTTGVADDHELTLEATRVDPTEVPDGATVTVTAPDLHQLVADAASTDGRVDLVRPGNTDRDATLALGEFEYVEFRSETYDASASAAGFAEEASYQYSLVEVNDSEVDGDVLEYAGLNESERAVADQMLEGESYGVGHHEERPAASEPFAAEQYLRTDDATYQVREVVGDHAAHHMLRLDEADPGSDAQIVTVADRVPATDVAKALTAAAESGSTSVADANPVSEYLDSAGYVVAVDAVFTLETYGLTWGCHNPNHNR